VLSILVAVKQSAIAAVRALAAAGVIGFAAALPGASPTLPHRSDALWTEPAVMAESALVIGPFGTRAHARLQELADSGFSGAVVVERNDTLILRAGYGFANREGRLPFTSVTIAQIGSNTKQFTAAAVLDLVRQRKLRVTDSIYRYFPSAPAATRAVTIHQLLSHSSGMAEYCGADFARASREEFLRRCLAMPLRSAPGSEAYSNPGYSVLAAIVEQVSGKPIDTYLKERFFNPLAMTRTGYRFPGVARDQFALGYVDGENRGVIADRLDALGDDYWNLKGNGGMQASAADMYRWYRALRDAVVVRSEIRDAMFTPRVKIRDLTFEGYGWVVRTNSTGALEQVSHSGSDGVFLSTILWSPRRRLFVYMVTNGGESDLAKSVVREVVNAVTRPVP
jgi:CubicO group peptidase (beta-lactamase class C family)